MYSAGELNQIINIKRRVKIADGAGGFTESFSYFKRNIFAKLKQKKAGEKRDFDRNNPKNSTIFVVHNQQGFNNTDVIEHNGIDYNIINMPPYNSLGLYLEIECESGGAV